MNTAAGSGPSWLWVGLVAALHLTTFALVAYHCLRTRHEATSAVLWLLLAWFMPVAGAMLYLAFGSNRVPAKAWHKQLRDQEFLAERQAREDARLPLAYWRAVHNGVTGQPDDPTSHELNRTMDAILPEYPLLGGNRIDLLVTGEDAYPAMLAAINGARHHIHMQTFMVWNDVVGRLFLDLLAERAAAGVTVRLLYDRFGSSQAELTGLFRRYRGVPNLHIVGWSQAHPLKLRFQVNLRNHRKVMVVDGQSGFMGGINLHRENMRSQRGPPIRDYHFAVQGPVVQELQYSFLCDWYFMTDDDPEALLQQAHFPHLVPQGPAYVRLVNGTPQTEVEEMADLVFACLTTARRSILAVTPYFVPSADLCRALRVAALRGVDVRLVLPRVNNHPYAGYAGRAHYGDLLEAGVRIFLREPPFMHAKALIIDDLVAVVGSANLDVRSLRLNYETNLAVFDAGLLNELKRAVLDEIAESRELDVAEWSRRPSRERVIENLCNLLTPVL